MRYDQPAGTVVMDEKIYRVVNVYLEREAFMVVAVGTGPVRFEGENDYVLHDPDGRVILKGRHRHRYLIEAAEGDTVEVTLRCEVTGREADQL